MGTTLTPPADAIDAPGEAPAVAPAPALPIQARTEEDGTVAAIAPELLDPAGVVEGPLYPDELIPNTVPAIRDAVLEGIKQIYDPEIPINIWELGLIYELDVSEERHVNIKMTLTSPMCPTAQSLVSQVELAAREVPHVKDAVVDLVWEPPWSMDSMSEEGRLLLGF